MRKPGTEATAKNTTEKNYPELRKEGSEQIEKICLILG